MKLVLKGPTIPSHRIGKFHPDVYCYIAYSHLFPNTKPSLTYLLAQLKEFNFTDIVMVAAKFNLLISREENIANQKLQHYLYRYFLKEDHREKLLLFLKKYGNDFFLFNRHQFLFILKNCILYCTKDPTTDFHNLSTRERFGKCCLLANDFLEPIEKEIEDSADPELKRETLWKELLPGYELYIHPNTMLGICRYRILFRKILPSLKEHRSYIELNKLFQKYAGLSLMEYMSLIFSVPALYLHRTKEILRNPNAIIIEVENFTKNTTIAAESVKRTLDLISIPLEEYRRLILESRDLDLNYGFSPFKQFPIARLSDGRYFCFDYDFLLEKVADGIFWLIHDNLAEADKNDFRSFWGKMFEEYLKYLMEESGLTKDGIFIPNPMYDNTQEEVADGVIQQEQSLILFEFKYTNLSNKAKYSESKDDLMDEIKQKYEKTRDGKWKGYGQLAHNINKLFSKNNTSSCSCIDKNVIIYIYPVLITYEHVFNAPFTNHILNKRFQSLIDHSSIDPSKEIQQLTIISAEDFEAAMAYCADLPRLIKDRFSFDEELDSSFADYLKMKYRKDNIHSPNLFKAEYRAYAEETKKILFHKRIE